MNSFPIAEDKRSILRLFNTWFYIVVFVNVFLLLALYLRVDGIMAQFGPVVDWLSGRLSLAKENNIAVWWPGFLFILLSVHAFDGYVLHRKE